MKSVLICIVILYSIPYTQAQFSADFKTDIEIPSSPLKDQESSGTCWSFATTSFLETEALRMGKPYVSLSPVFYVHPTYLSKAEKFIATEGKSYFSPGDLTFSVLQNYQRYGAIPEEIYNGVIDGDWQHDHVEMDNLLLAMVESIGTSGYGRIKPKSWKQSISAVLDAYLGTPPSSFNYKGENYSPKDFAKKFVGIEPSDYIEITSYSHGEYYRYFELNIPANWNQNQYLNLPLKDFQHVVKYAIENGFTMAWDGDATEPYFDFEKGVLRLSEDEENDRVTQEMRQEAFEHKHTTDDHNMHIVGRAIDPKGGTYYLIKNSEGMNEMGGYIYMSQNALLLKTISLLVHKDGIPPVIMKKVKSQLKK